LKKINIFFNIITKKVWINLYNVHDDGYSRNESSAID
jgi:hypothetical protein